MSQIISSGTLDFHEGSKIFPKQAAVFHIYLKSLVDNNSLILVIILLLMWEQLPKQKSATLIFDICKLLIEM